MKIAILGAGNVGCVLAADLTIKGHEVMLIKTSSSLHNDNFKYLQMHGGKLSLLEKGKVCEITVAKCEYDISLIQSAEMVIVTIQTCYHENLIQKIAPYLKDGQIVMFVPGYLATAYMLKYCFDKNIAVVEAESSPIDCRLGDKGVCKVCFRNVRNPLGVFPQSKLAEVKQKCDLLGLEYHYLNNVVEAALHNPNLIVHTVGAIMSIPRIEYSNGDYCMYKEVFTPRVWNLLEKLDAEKIAVLKALGCLPVSYIEACKFRNSLDDKRDAKEVFFEYANSPDVVPGPAIPDSRYVTEDVSQGLVMLEALGRQLGIATPVSSALIEIANAALQKDFRENGRTLEKLGLDNVAAILQDAKGN